MSKNKNMKLIKGCEVAFAEQRLEKNFNNLSENDELKKYRITNLWKYDLPDGWRLLYSITTPSKVEILSIIIEWFNHKNYGRRFRYLF